MDDFERYLNEQMQDPEFAEEYEALQPEYEAIRAVIAARTESHMTQKQLAEKTGIRVTRVDITDELAITVGVDGRFTVNLGTSNYIDKKFAHLSGMIKNMDASAAGKINLSMWTPSNTEGSFVSAASGG